MGKYSISEKKALKQLGISDFRHMTKDKIMSFATMLPYMDPEVAKKALEQFPTFKDLASDIVCQYKALALKIFEENRESQKTFYEACMSIIKSLQKELEEENVDSSERARIEDNMIQVATMIGEKDSENKGMFLKILGTVGVIGVAVASTTAAILGANSHSNGNENYRAVEDNDDHVIDV